ncbi:hypothetical protein WJX72_006183 [[Myrmecia] bisecta]|uniref:ER membrane protein complex subunit 6 n=1 Tax=[Myrmecia] bisecta TaxID=41462 RepID=A0AAW1PG94_9CHLO
MAPRTLNFGEEMLNMQHMKHNAGIINFVRVFASLVAGILAGVLGVEGWGGFLYYLVIQAVVSGLLHIKAKGNAKQYFKQRRELYIDQVFTSTTLLTFILFWTISHNFIHLF